MEDIKKALQLKVELDLLRPIAKEQENRILQKFRLDWNYHSNHLEGNSLTYGETKALILFGITAQGKPLKDTLEITGHNEAINWVLEMVSGDRPLTENFIRELHSLLLKDSYKESKNEKGEIIPRKISAGKYKTTPNHVQTRTGEIFYFASPEETPAKMHDLLTWYNEKIVDTNSNPLLIAAEFHYKFILIHPFDDGNGRTARILMNFILMKFGYPPVIIKTEDKANYFAALQMADAGNIEVFINYIAQNLNRSLEIMIAGAKGEDIEEADDLDKEIALLEKRLENSQLGKKVLTKNEVSMIVEDSYIPLLKLYIEKSKVFQKFYRDYFFSVTIADSVTNLGYSLEGNTGISFLNTMKDYVMNFYETYGNIKFGFSYSIFKYNNFGDITFLSYLQLKFDLNSYKLLDNENNILIEKLYGTQLTELEIDKIVKLEIKRHKQFIERKISEIENNQ